MEKVVPDFINISFRSYCKKCKEPKIFIGDHRNDPHGGVYNYILRKVQVMQKLTNIFKGGNR